LAELNRRLSKLDDATADKALDRALQAGAAPIVAKARSLTPRSSSAVGSRGRGHAADHIRAKLVDGPSRNPAILVGPQLVEQTPARSGNAQQAAVPSFAYLAFVEYGVPSRGIPAIAPLRRAADSEFRRAARSFHRALKREIDVALR